MTQELIWLGIQYLSMQSHLLPHSAALSLGGSLGRMVFSLNKDKSSKAIIRCSKFLGCSLEVAREVVAKSYINLGRSVVEFLNLAKIGKKIDEIVSAHDIENLNDALACGRGVILLTAHLGNWELAAAYLGIKDYPMRAIGAEQRDARITKLITDIRASCGVETIGKGFDLRGAIRCLQEGNILGVLLDQDAKDKGIIAPFLGQPASTPYGPVKLAMKMRSPIVPLFIVRRKDNIHHDLYFLPSLEERVKDFYDRPIEENVRLCNDILSEWISRHPEQWLWLYPRWASTLGDR
ncbi:lysophospholipid acyltransferase family protein [Acetomicrobium hydrogeniformans]|uniref:Lipid A biosynthesis (KDO)2-(Lauroyl)-lipid IVA acyltransferase n=1 Tax=Acetomicrobium hydrogeniformans ATCC BAA-1850 TaxID=592015 RepID=A0A0T5XB56_9BACT|nr:lysophospholipid acyltransferase family protein [Acetomicrobium hydrogeniformans]KRT35537.1 lipid A biosynthesis (KDO)2-(lauroyl)-lipid IVA acyltransferase [Acetomicrobium hydrogeniformans ATCC BAA-1850]